MTYKKKMLLTAAAGTILSLCCLAADMGGREPVRTLLRPENGEGEQELGLVAELEGETYPVAVTLLEVPMKEVEVRQRLSEASEGLEELFLKDNQDPEHIVSDLYMPAKVPDTQITIGWYLDSWEYVDPDGTVKNALLSGEAAVKVQAELTLQGQKEFWEREIRILPPDSPDTEQKVQMLEYQIRKAQENSSEREFALPASALGQTVVWYPEADDRWIFLLLLTGAAVCVVYVGRKKEEEQAQKQKDRSMQMDYPEIVSRLSLYMGAGISSRNAWERIVESYEKKSRETGKPREAYEEMRTALHEMQSGVPETLAYERFGTRCRLPSYLKLGALLSQNLRKGTRNLAELLEWESREAFENRKAFAKKMGEECESRLLLPMLLLLLTVLIMVMYPAIVSFQV